MICRNYRRWMWPVLGITLLPGLSAQAQNKGTVDFNRQILPILSDNCFACHGPDANQRKAKLRLDTKTGAFSELRSGDHAIVPGRANQSVLVERVTAAESARRMPPARTGKKLSPEQIALLKTWIDQGAPWSEHWAWQPPRRTAIPKVNKPGWVQDPIDAFILARLEAEHLQPSAAEERVRLIRRVTLDLTGLPPTPAEVDAYVADSATNAYEKVVDRLLQSSRFGEHMARFWLDAARYGDTHGLHLDNYREMWPYREWVIKAFNANLPYDQFLIKQLAGDLLPGATLDDQIASGFNRCHVTTNEGGSIEEEVYVRNVVDRIDTTTTVLLGLSAGCARCHDHKYDPIRSKDYYQLFAFFNSLDAKPMDDNAAQVPPIVRVPTLEQAAAVMRLDRQIAQMRRYVVSHSSQVKHIRGMSFLKLAQPGRITFLAADDQVPVFDPLDRRFADLKKARRDAENQEATTLVSHESPHPRPAFILTRGEYEQRGERVERGTPAFLPPLPAGAPRNRLGFAQWVVSPTNPLTARAEVNRLWQQCFGTGLVKTAEDFGAQGEPPSHPELLDWLAVQFVEDGWDVKRMLKRLVLSATYQQSSRLTTDRLAKDPANRLLSRGPRFRLDAEAIRDQALFVSGLLIEHVGGPSVKPPQPAGLWEAVGYVTSNTARFTPDTGNAKVHRRSIYTFWKRTAPPPQMAALDAPSREACRVRRERTDTPLQALLLMNETQFVEASRSLAQRVLHEGGSTTEDRMRHLFRLATARHPDPAELRELMAVYHDHRATYDRDPVTAKKLNSVGESSPDSTLPPSELAAWTMVANLLLNLDEVVTKG